MKQDKHREPCDFIGKRLKQDLSGVPVRVVSEDTDEKVVYGYRFEPRDCEEGVAFHEGSACAYEIHVICSKEGIIDDVNQMIEQRQCGHGRSFSPNSTPAWMFPVGAMFDLEWEDVVPVCQERMLKLLTAMTEGGRTPPTKRSSGDGKLRR